MIWTQLLLKYKLKRTVVISFLIAAPVRLILELFPDISFWHLQEILNLPGMLIQGLVSAMLYFWFSSDASASPGGIDKIVNFVLLYAVVFVIVFIVMLFVRRKSAVICQACG